MTGAIKSRETGTNWDAVRVFNPCGMITDRAAVGTMLVKKNKKKNENNVALMQSRTSPVKYAHNEWFPGEQACLQGLLPKTVRDGLNGTQVVAFLQTAFPSRLLCSCDFLYSFVAPNRSKLKGGLLGEELQLQYWHGFFGETFGELKS